MAWKKDDEKSAIEQKIKQSFGNSIFEPGKDATKDLKLVNFSFPIDYKEKLTNHFKAQGKSFSTGVREILIKYMNENGIL